MANIRFSDKPQLTALAGDEILVATSPDGGTDTDGNPVAAGADVRLPMDQFALHLRKPAVQDVATAATVTPTAVDDLVRVTAQAGPLTLANPTGALAEGWGWVIRIKDNGTARAISYGTQYRAVGLTLPAGTVAGKTTYLGCIWNATDSKVDVVSAGTQA